MNSNKILEEIKDRFNAQPGEANFEPGYYFKGPWQDTHWLINRVENLTRALELIKSGKDLASVERIAREVLEK